MMLYTRVNVIKSNFEKQRRRKEVKTLMSDASIVPTPSKVHKASVKWFPEQDNWYKVVIMQLNARM